MSPDPASAPLHAARQILLAARRLVVISGAGMSAESGIATFRGTGSTGGWNQVAPILATPEGFAADPQRVWTRYLQRRQEARAAHPHPGYQALVAWERHAEVTIITQNVDGLHWRAGSSQVIELHGSLFRFFCVDQQHAVTGVGDTEQVPRCPQCGSYVRPAVVWFEEWLPAAALRASEEAVRQAQAILLVGTSLEVSSPKSLLAVAARRGTPIIEVNPEPALPSAEDRLYEMGTHPVPAAAVSLVGTAATILPHLLAVVPPDP